MLAKIAIALIVLWLVGVLVFEVLGAIVHIALLAGIVLLAMHFMRGRSGV